MGGKVLHPEEKSKFSRVEKSYVEDLILIWTEHENVRKENVFNVQL